MINFEIASKAYNIELGDVGTGTADLIIIPCSGKMKLAKDEVIRTQLRIEQFDIPSPREFKEKFKFGEISPLIEPRKSRDLTKYISYAATVLNETNEACIENIGRKIGELTRSHPEISLIECPFLGTGHGKLQSDVAVPALIRGFMATRRDGSLLQLRSDSYDSVSAAINAMKKTELKKTVLIIHGANTRARWQSLVSSTISNSVDCDVFPISYGYFDIFSLLLPSNAARRKPIDKIHREIRNIISSDQSRNIYIIAHSYGSYAISNILMDFKDIRISGLILCGSIVKRDFDWGRISEQVKHTGSQISIINECGLNDIFPPIAANATWGYGATGTFGFGSSAVKDRKHKFGHSGYFNRDFVIKYWIPFITSGKIETTAEDLNGAASPFWVNLASITAKMLVPIAIIVPFILFISHYGTSGP